MSLGQQVVRIAKAQWRSTLRVAGSLVAVVLCMASAWAALKIGDSRLKLARAESMSAVNTAVELAPLDPFAYRERAAELLRHREFSLAVADLRRAISLRPTDYELWSELGAALNQLDEPMLALSAFDEAERLAPGYASTHWEKGKQLLKLGKRDAAFAELRIATINRLDLFVNLLELATKERAADLGELGQLVGARNNRERLVLAQFLVRHHEPDLAMTVVREINELSRTDRRLLVNQLIDAKDFGNAYALWAEGSGGSSFGKNEGTVIDGGFEQKNALDRGAFGWTEGEIRGASVSIDSTNSRTEKQSLRIDWNGNPDVSERVISQLILVEPSTEYNLTFEVKTNDLITGGAPVIEIADVTQAESRFLGKSEPFPTRTSDWQVRSIKFATEDSSRAVRITLRRESCPMVPCPIFGVLWLDDFSMTRLGTPIGHPARKERAGIESANSPRVSQL